MSSLEGQVPAMSARYAHSDGSASSITSVPPGSQYSNSNTPEFKVFISHAGEDDKANIAIPLRDMLAKENIRAFVDYCDIVRGTNAIDAMVRAMNKAQIAVVVLSPEFVAREWPIKELMHFLRRYEECSTSHRESLTIIPFFYRLSVKEMYDEPKFDRIDKDGNNLYETSRFHKRRANGEVEADPDAIKKALNTLHSFMGIENSYGANNDPSHYMVEKRDILLKKLCTAVCEAAGRTRNAHLKGPDLFKPYSKRNAEDGVDLNRRAYLLRDGAAGAERNAKEAVEFRRAVDGGNVRAMNNLANLLVKGADGVEQNAKEAAGLYRRAIEGGSVEARNNLAKLLANGADGVEQNAKEAVGLYRHAIASGNVRAMNNLANLLTHGADGVERNAREAVKLYRRAIKGGSVEARNNLANLLTYGADGVEQNTEEAKELYRRAI